MRFEYTEDKKIIQAAYNLLLPGITAASAEKVCAVLAYNEEKLVGFLTGCNGADEININKIYMEKAQRNSLNIRSLFLSLIESSPQNTKFKIGFNDSDVYNIIKRIIITIEDVTILNEGILHHFKIDAKKITTHARMISRMFEKTKTKIKNNNYSIRPFHDCSKEDKELIYKTEKVTEDNCLTLLKEASFVLFEDDDTDAFHKESIIAWVLCRKMSDSEIRISRFCVLPKYRSGLNFALVMCNSLDYIIKHSDFMLFDIYSDNRQMLNFAQKEFPDSIMTEKRDYFIVLGKIQNKVLNVSN